MEKYEKAKIIIYGVGEKYEKQVSFLKDYFSIIGYYDKDKQIMDWPKADLQRFEECDYVYITSKKYKNEIANELQSRWKVEPKKIITEKEVLVDNPIVKKRYCELNNWDQVKKELSFIKHDIRKIAIIGVNEYSIFFYKNICLSNGDRMWGIIPTRKDMVLEENFRIKNINELFFEDDILVYIFESNNAIKIKGQLLEMGIDKQSIKILCEDETRGTKKFDTYDALLGLTRSTDLQGFVTFENQSNMDKKYTIVTLGGSTTDPTLCNLKSWSEFLYEQLQSIGINARVICGGIASYTVTQELLKLIRDVVTLVPDLVISYSGINDASELYYCEKSFYTLQYQDKLLEKCIENNMVRNELQSEEIIDKVTYGIDMGEKSTVQHWLDSERMMHAVCDEFNIKFVGFLQPYVKNWWNDKDRLKNRKIDTFYSDARRYLKQNNYSWLFDLSEIFESEENVFFDGCHVYEKGNQMIVRHMLPYILKEIRR